MEVSKNETIGSLREALNLLESWNLECLCQKFEEQEVCIEALRHLTEADIIELIPKIGPRSIFRFHLRVWRQQQQQQQFKHNQKSTVLLNDGNADITTTTTTVSIKEELPCDISPEYVALQDQCEDFEKEELCDDSRTETLMSDEKTEYSQVETKIRLDVHSVLTKYDEGLNALDYQNENGGLNMHYRKKVVNLVIAAALQRRMDMSANDLDDIAQQIVRLFPKESQSTFYIPRMGGCSNSRPRGMLYNKYVNLARNLRKEGRLGYKRNSLKW